MKNILNAFILIVIFSLIILSLGILIIDNDISLQKPIDTIKLGKLPGQKIWLISYANGNVIHIKNQNFLSYTALNQGIDIIINYRKEHIDSEFYKKNEKILDSARGAGYWLWKPYFILQTLNSMPENDILIYADSGYIINDTLTQLIKLTNAHNMVLLYSTNKLETLTKHDAVIKMGMDNMDLSNYQISGSLLIMKNVQIVRNFIEEWLFYCEDPEILTDMPSINKEYDNFKDHRHDQIILSLLYYRHKDYGFYVYPTKDKSVKADGVFYHHHRRNPDDIYNQSISIEEDSSLAVWQHYVKNSTETAPWYKQIQALTIRLVFYIYNIIYSALQFFYK